MIRVAVIADAARIAELEAAALGADAWTPSLIEQGLAGDVPTVSYLVAEAEGTVVGYAAASVVADIAELQRIAVHSEHRRTGLATALLEQVVSRAREQGADRLLLEVRVDNSSALAFYAASGFVEIDRRPRYYRDGASAVVMRRGLRGACG